MVFADINCGFYMGPRDGMLVAGFEQVAAVCEEFGIQKRVMYNKENAGAPLKEKNAMTCALCREHGGVPALHLLPPAYGSESYTEPELEEIIGRENPVFRISPKTDACPFTEWMYGFIPGLLERERAPLLAPLEEVDLRDAAQIMRSYPELRLVLTNTTQWMNRQYVRFMQEFPSVYLETCNVIEYYGLENLTRILGASRLLFGTNMPDKEPYDKVFQMLRAEISDEEKELISHGNYERLVERRE